MQIPIRSVLLSLFLIIAFLLAMHFVPESYSWTLDQRFNLDEEGNFPTYASVLLLLGTSISALLIHFFRKNTEDDKDEKPFWLFFAAVYFFLALDEGCRFHEVVQARLHGGWICYYSVLGAFFFLVCLRYFLKVNKEMIASRNWIIGGLVVFAVGGMLVEFVYTRFAPPSHELQQVEFVVEEGLEMIGCVLVLMGCFAELNRLNKKYALRIHRRA